MDFLRGKAVEKAVTYIENIVNRDKNFGILKRKLEELNSVKEDNESAKSNQLLDPRKKLKKQAENWFRNVERVTVEINDLENEITRSNVLSSIGGTTGGKLLERIQEVEDLLQKGQNFDSLVIDDPQWIGQVLSTTTLFGEVPTKLMEEIWEYCTKLKKIPIIFPLGDDGLPSPPPLKRIVTYPAEENWCETVEWYQPEIKSMVEHLVTHDISHGQPTFERKDYGF